jgi:hypothetical protein
LAGLPNDARVLSATTDGFLTDADDGATALAASGLICRSFADLRALVDPRQSRDVLEVKHRALKVFVPRTRGAFTIELAPPVASDPPEIATTPICARAGHRFPHRYDESERLAECLDWLSVSQERDAATKLDRRYLISIREMDQTAGDLIDIFTRTALSMDYDYKRAPVPASVCEADGLVRFETAPLPSLDEFHDARRDFKRWRKATSSVLKTEADYHRFEAWRATPRARSAGLRTPAQQALMVAWAKGLYGLPRHSKRGVPPAGAFTFAVIADILTRAGVPGVTLRIVRHAATRLRRCRLRASSRTTSRRLPPSAKPSRRARSAPYIRLLRTRPRPQKRPPADLRSLTTQKLAQNTAN